MAKLKLWVDFWPGQVLIVGKRGEEVEETEEQVIEQFRVQQYKTSKKGKNCTVHSVQPLQSA